MRSGLFAVKVFCLLLSFVSCSKDRFDEPQELGGVLISAERLNRGHRVYSSFCARCHAKDGAGVLNRHRSNNITDLRLGVYKYALGLDGALPPDQELIRVIRNGLGAKRMPAFSKLSDQQLNDVTQFIKTLSPRWTVERAGAALKITKDPWGDAREPALERGLFVYHAIARCWTCHPSLVDEASLTSMLRSRSGSMEADIRPHLKQSVPVSTPYGTMFPPDFREADLRVGTRAEDLYRVIALGVPGSAMPSWSDSFSQKDLWSLVHLIRDVQRKKQ